MATAAKKASARSANSSEAVSHLADGDGAHAWPAQGPRRGEMAAYRIIRGSRTGAAVDPIEAYEAERWPLGKCPAEKASWRREGRRLGWTTEEERE
jgi:hypothetical protein